MPDQPPKPTSRQWKTWTAVVIALDLLVTAACLLALGQNVSLRRQLADAIALLEPSVSSSAPAIAGQDRNGRNLALGYLGFGPPTLVYTFSRECVHCEANWRAMKPLQRLGERELRMVYVDTDGDNFMPRYLARTGIGRSPLLVRLWPEAALAYEARLLPQCELLANSGRVEWSQVGELRARDVSQVLSMIRAHQIKNRRTQ